MEQEISKTVVFPNGDVLSVVTVRKLLFQYWQLSEAEKRAFDRLCNRPDLKEKFDNTYKHSE